MKRTGSWRVVGGLVVACLVAASAEATTYTWTGGSSGTWNTASNNWSGATTTPLWDLANGTNNVALFNANADTATVSGTVYANGVTFNSPAVNAVITNGTLTLGGLTPAISYGVVTAGVNSAISATPEVTISGSSGGRLELGGGGNNSFAGGVSVSGGYIVMNKDRALGYRTPLVVKDGATVSINGKTFYISSLTLSNGNCGVANSGNLYFYSANPVITSDGNSSMKPSQIQNGYGTGVNFNFVVNSGTNEVGFNYFLPGYNSLTKSGNGMMMIKVASTTGPLYTNSLTIAGGIYSVDRLYDANTTGTGLGGSVNDATNLVLNGGTLQFTGGNNNDGAGKVRNKTDRRFSVGTSGGAIDASGSAPVNFYNTGAMGFNSQTGARSLTLTGSNTGTNTLAAAIGDNSGATAVVKGGAGTWVLAGNNSYSGGTTVSNGTLVVAGATALGVGSITMAGGTLDLGGFTVTNGAVTLSQGTISNGTLSAGALDISGAAFIDYSATLAVSNSLTKSGSGTVELYDNYGYSGSTYVNAGMLSLAPVPSVMTGCVAWFDAGDASTLTTNATGIVTNWANKGSAGATLDAVLQQAGSGPTVLANDLNGKSVLSVSVKGLQTRNNIGISGGQDRTMFLVGCRTTTDNFYMGGMGKWGTTKAYFGIRSGTGGISYALYGNDIPLPAQPAGLYEIYDFSLASSNGVACLISNGVFFTQSTALQPSTTNTPLYLGSDPAYNSSGKLAEVIVFNRAVTPQERATIEKYLYTKWFSSTPVLPATTKLALATGATLNLNGSASVAELSGSGAVSNGTLTVTSSINLTNGVAANLLVHSNLTVAAGAALCYDYTSTTSDVVNVTGTLTLQGTGNTVTLNAIGSVTPPPNRITLFTFGTCPGDPSSWSVQGALQPGYSYRVRKDAGSVYVSVARMGTMIRFY